MEINNRRYLKAYRRNLRNYGTSAEATLWLQLKCKQLEGRKFRRQHSVGNYILDFYCPAEKLAVELDGAHHFTEEGLEADREREEYLLNLNIRTVRFENKTVFENMEGVLSEIRSCFDLPTCGTPPSKGGE